MNKLLFVIALLTYGVNAQTHFSENFNTVEALTGWTITDVDGDGHNWISVDWSFSFPELEAGTAGSFSWNHDTQTPLTPDNFLTSSAIDLSSASASNLILEFTTGGVDPDYFTDEYSVYITTSTDPATIITSPAVFNEVLTSHGLFTRVVDISAYAGQTVYLTFRHFNTVDENLLLIDNITIKSLLDNDAKLEALTTTDASLINNVVTITGDVKNNGANAITSLDVNWTIDGGASNTYALTGLNIAPGETYSFTHPTTWDANPLGERSLEVNVSNINGTTDPDLLNNSITQPITVYGLSEPYFSEDFEDTNLDNPTWTNTDVDGDGYSWGYGNISSVFPELETLTVASFSKNTDTGDPLFPNNFLTSTAIDLTTANPYELFLKFTAGSFNTSNFAEEYSVYLTTSPDPALITNSSPLFSEILPSGDVFTHAIDVSAFVGQIVYLTFRHFNTTDMNALLIDNITIGNTKYNDAKLAALTMYDVHSLSASVTMTGDIKNNGVNAITALDVNWAIDGGAFNTFAITGLNIAPGANYSFTHPTLWSSAPYGTRSLEVTISNVNGYTDSDLTNNSLTQPMFVVSEIFEKAVVYEEWTGTWCGFCPKGIVGLKDMYHYYNDGSFIGIAVQNGPSNPMRLTSYDAAIGSQLTGVPSGLFNREPTPVSADFDLIETAYLANIIKVPVAKVEITNSTWNSATREISVDLSAKFALDLGSTNYNVSVVVVENGVTGTDDGYKQANFYSGGSNDLIDWEGINWRDLPHPVTAASMVYNHVGRALLGGFGGIAGVIPSSVTYNTPYTHTFTYTLPASQNQDEIHLVAMIINNATNEIVNAVEVELNTTNFTNDAKLEALTTTDASLINDVVTITGDVKNYGANAITSLDVNWTIDGGASNTYALTGLNIAPGETYSFTHPTTWDANPLGERSLEVNVSNINGTADPDLLNNSITQPITVYGLSEPYFSEDFEDTNLDNPSWTNTDVDGDGYSWEYENISSVFPELETLTVASFSKNTDTGDPLFPNNFLTSIAIDLTTANPYELFLKFTAGSFNTSNFAEEYSVYLTTSPDPALITNSSPLFSEILPSGDVFTHAIDVSAFVGQIVYLTFRHFNTTDMNALLIDNITIGNTKYNDAKLAALTMYDVHSLSTSVTMTGDIKNNGINAITALDVNWAIDGGAFNTFAITGLNIAPGANYSFTHPTLWSSAPYGTRSLEVTISNVNGNTDSDLTNNSLTQPMFVVSEIFEKAVVYEESTNTWCGYCPEGIVGLKDMYHYYNDGSFIGIAVQSGPYNPMRLTSYDAAIGSQLTGVQSGLFNREPSPVYADFEIIETAYLANIIKVPVAKVEITNSTWDLATREISVDLSAKFALDLGSTNYNVSVVVVENGVTGTGNGYNQHNYYSGGSNDLIDWEGINWRDLPDPVTAASMVYNHVGRALLGGFGGVAGVIPSSVTYNTPYTHTFTYTLPAWQNQDEIHLVAMIINNATNEIVNAVEVELNTTHFTYDAATYCIDDSDPTPTIIGLGGGTFSSTAGLVFISTETGEVDLSASTPGNYTVSYATSGAISNSSSVSFTLNSVAVCQNMAACALSTAELITNGNFETGDLTGWSGSNLVLAGGCSGQDWTVYDDINSISYCNATGDPVSSGTYAAYTGFDNFYVPINYYIQQQIVVPAVVPNANLSWLQDFQIDIFSGQDRSFTIDLYDADGLVFLDNLYTQNFSVGNSDSGGWVSQSIDPTILLQSYLNQTLTLRINAFIPEVFPGTGGFSLNDVSLTISSGGSGRTTVWDGASWSNGAPDASTYVVIDGPYSTTSGSFDACALQIDNDLTIAAGTYINVTNNILVQATGSLTVAHTGSLVQLEDTAEVTNNGSISVLVDTPTLEVLDFMIMGSPMSGETRGDVWSSAWNVQAHITANFNSIAGIPGYNFLDAELDDWNLYETGALSAGEGYLVRPQTSYNGAGGIFSYDYNIGTLNNGVVTSTLGFNVTALESPNMLSNPYPSAIDADVFLSANPQIDGLYFWEHNTAPSTTYPGAETNGNNYSMDDVSFYNSLGGVAAASDIGETNTPNGVISTAQGFGVFAAAAGTAAFNNSMRLTTGNTTLRNNTIAKDRLWLRVTSSAYNVSGSTLVGFVADATAGIDIKYDSGRIASKVSIYSHIDGSDRGYTVQAREAFDNGMTVALGFSSIIEEVTTYKISLSDLDGAAWLNATPYLIDAQAGVVTNLNEDAYSFTSDQGEFNNRFTLVFQDRLLGSKDVLASSISMYPNPASDLVTIVSPNAAISLVEVRDLRGRLILTNTIASQQVTSLNITSLDNAVYLVTITTDSGTSTSRLIVK
ncbi:choice-of-anchor J domain-containing protein [Patiriisocius sp. Uisw_047]|uniref:choice-of-anchor J domain-containing protein n=1 Tax=Patiriisocius sp. Uisw_047 TaxID=3230969 RepID=UPI0039EA00D4